MYVGENLYGWSQTIRTPLVVYFLGSNPNDVLPSTFSSYSIGFPLRCLYPGSA